MYQRPCCPSTLLQLWVSQQLGHQPLIDDTLFANRAQLRKINHQLRCNQVGVASNAVVTTGDDRAAVAGQAANVCHGAVVDEDVGEARNDDGAAASFVAYSRHGHAIDEYRRGAAYQGSQAMQGDGAAVLVTEAGDGNHDRP